MIAGDKAIYGKDGMQKCRTLSNNAIGFKMSLASGYHLVDLRNKCDHHSTVLKLKFSFISK